MKLPVVSIIGRPNTGKSSLFNSIVGRGKAIVFDKSGTTIDINKEVVSLDEVKFILQDTGGYMIDNNSDAMVPQRLVSRIRSLIQSAIEESSLILFTVEYDHIEFIDYELANILRKYSDKVKLVVTKVDSYTQRINITDEIYRLGFNNIIFVSSKTKYGFDDLLDSIRIYLLSYVNFESDFTQGKEEIKVSIVGRVNVGKSSLMNAFLGKNRSMVDSEPGTTRDSIDDFLDKGELLFRITDTAGFRRSIFKAGFIESFGIERAKRSIENADVVLVVIDGKEGITKQDKKVLGVVIDSYKPYVVVVNKWDLVVSKGKFTDEVEMKKYHDAFKDFLSRTFESAKHAPVVLTSATERYNIGKIFEEILNVYNKASKRISTGILNRSIRKVIPHYFSGELSTKLRIYYLTQVDINPPTFVIFVNKKEHFRQNIENFIKRKITEIFDFGGVPLRIEVKEKERKKLDKVG
ncbi:MAG: ribosome biogenesis GTPase Der [Brevinematia bacterium]